MAIRNSTQATPPCHTRKIKVGYMIYDYQRKNHRPPQATVPWLQLKGHWLEKAGFTIDAPVTVQVMDKCLVLTTE
jgi:toxic protein SymE